MNLGPLIPIIAILVFGLMKLQRGPIGQALAERIRGVAGGPSHEHLDDLQAQIDDLRQQLIEAHERLDFAERMLTRPRDEIASVPGSGTSAL